MVYSFENGSSKNKIIRNFAWAAGDVVKDMGIRDVVSKIDVISPTLARCVFVHSPAADGDARDKIVQGALGKANYVACDYAPTRSLSMVLTTGELLVDVDAKKYYLQVAEAEEASAA